MKNLVFGISALILSGGGCTTVPQYHDLSALEKQHLTQRQICEFEVRVAHDRFKETRDWTVTGALGVAIVEAAREEDEYWTNSPLAPVAIYAGIGYMIDDFLFNKRVKKCIESKTIVENQIDGRDENTVHPATFNQSD